VLVSAFVVHGILAIIIILVILAIIVLGVISFLRLTARGAKKVVDGVENSTRGRSRNQ
jgi:uncharacterized protein YoxC